MSKEVVYEGGNIPPMQSMVYINHIGYYVASYEENDDGTITAILRKWIPF